jgi:hypothetical protein
LGGVSGNGQIAHGASLPPRRVVGRFLAARLSPSAPSLRGGNSSALVSERADRSGAAASHVPPLDGRLYLGRQGRLQCIQVGRSENDSVTCGDVYEVEVDAGLGDLTSEVRKYPGIVLDVHDYDLALAADR